MACPSWNGPGREEEEEDGGEGQKGVEMPTVYTRSGLYSPLPPSEQSELTQSTVDSTLDSTCELLASSSAQSSSKLEHPACTSHSAPCELPMERDCGILSCRPSFLQTFANIKIFVLLLSLLVTLQQALASGYLNSVITTIEKRFEIPSSLSGLVASTYEIGNVITVIFVSYLGSRRHIPVWIGVGALITGIGSMVFSVPHFTSESYTVESDLSHNNSESNICRSSVRDPATENLNLGLGRLTSGLSSPSLSHHNGLHPREGGNCIEGPPSNTLPILLFMLGQLLLGCGGSPLFTLGTTYIDDHVTRENASMYMGFMYSMAAFGPVCGFLLGAYLLSFYVDLFSYTKEELNLISSAEPSDTRWIGMWWGGFLLCGLFMVVMSIPFFAFPKTLRRDRDKVLFNEKTKDFGQGFKKKKSGSESKTKQRQNTDNAYGKDIKDIPQSMWKLVCNSVYVVTCLGACMELIIVSGFVIFLPKYLETQFSLSKSQASVFTGGIAIPGACVGIFMGGCLLKRLQLRPKGAAQFVLLCNLLCLACYALLLFLGCDNLKMAGATMPYFNSTKAESFQVNLTAACNFGCECALDDVQPVCGNDGLTYFSPCHAGCTTPNGFYNYSDCACIHRRAVRSSNISGVAELGYAEVTVIPVATAGPCASPCHTILPFMLLLFFMTFIVAVTQMPLLMIVLRSVEAEERSFALGMQFVIFRLFGYIPSPIMFGNIIDSTCLLWKSSCGEKGGRCLVYDIELFRYKYVGICAGIKLVALALFLLGWYLIRRRHKMEAEGTLTVGEIVNSIISLDKLFEEPEETVWFPAVQREKSALAPNCPPAQPQPEEDEEQQPCL